MSEREQRIYQQCIDRLRSQRSQNEDLHFNISIEMFEVDIFTILKEIENDAQYDNEERLIVPYNIDFNGIHQSSNLHGVSTLYFNDIVFKGELLNFDILSKYNIIFQNCKFDKKIKLTIPSDKTMEVLLLQDSILKNSLEIYGNISHLSLLGSSIKNLIMRGTIDTFVFNKATIKKGKITESHFINKVECRDSVIQKFDIIDSEFDEGCEFFNKKLFEKKTKISNSNFLNNTFKKEVVFTQCSLDKVKFTNSTFEDKAIFYNTKLTGCDFSRTKFDGEADFKDSKLTNCDFSFTRFMDEADFKRVKFHGENIFEYTQFNDRGAFYGAYFENDPVFHNLILGKDSHLYFGEVNKYIKAPNNEEYFKNPKTYQVTDEYIKDLEKNLKISIEIKGTRSYEDVKEQIIKQIVIKKFTIANTIINGRSDFNNDNIATLDMKGCVIAGTLSRVQFNNIVCVNWETATLLKHEELKIDNLIRALKYQAIEKDRYMIESFKKFRWGESLSLLLSKIFHNHGQIWLLALFWTISIWIGTFISFRWGFGQTGIDTIFISDFIKYLSPTEYAMLTDCIKNLDSLSTQNWLGIAFYMLGKIFVPYGIFEIVRAFRKLK